MRSSGLARNVADLASLVVIDVGFVGNGGMDGEGSADAGLVLLWRLGVDGLAVLTLMKAKNRRYSALPS